jgi:polyisoprenoid-binding protein YceI
LLSPVAHDLKLKVTRFSLTVAADRVEGRWDAGSLEVASVMRDGREVPGALGRRDFDKIAKTIREDVLSSRRHPEIAFRSDSVVVDGERAVVKGSLTLAGKSRPLTIEAGKRHGRWIAEVSLHQPDFGIKPYSAMFGTLRIKPDVKVVVSVPADAVGAT